MAKLITPEIFQKNTAEDYLKAAIDTAEWIDTLAIKTEYGRIWQALPEGQDGYREDVPLFTSKKHSWGFWNCQCQCCGTAGILEHFAAMYEYTGEKEFYDDMIRTADVMLSDSDHRTPGLRIWYDSWWRTIPTRVVSYPGLYVGVAGCASSLLRTYAALTGKKLTNLYEYHFFEKF